MILSLLLPLLAFSAPWKQIWEVPVTANPRAALFDVTSGMVLVALDNAGEASVRRISLRGVAEKNDFVSTHGSAGAMRGYDGRIFWLVGNSVVSFSALEGGRVRKEGDTLSARDITLNAKGAIFVGGDKGLAQIGVAKPLKDFPVTGLFTWVAETFSLKGGKSLVGLGGKEEKICTSDCEGLERAPDGTWITGHGKEIVRAPLSATLVAGKTKPGRFAYAYQRDSRDDILVVPFPEENMVRAYRAAEDKK